MKALGQVAVLLVLTASAPWGDARAQTAQAAQAAHTEKWELMPPWRVLKRGMTPAEVIDTLGKPSQPGVDALSSWNYYSPSSGKAGSVSFRKGRLSSWGSPNFETVEGASNTRWANIPVWSGIYKGMTQEQVEKALGVATWVSISNGHQVWHYYESATGRTGSVSFHNTAVSSWLTPTY